MTRLRSLALVAGLAAVAAASACGPSSRTTPTTGDEDADGFSIEAGDCDDLNPAVHPDASEGANGIDDDCDGLVDNHTPQFDDDGDGYSEVQGDCDDTAVTGPSIGPDAVEVNELASGDAEGLDNDCDGMIDEGEEPCQSGGSDAFAYAAAMDVCHQVIDATWRSEVDSDTRAVLTTFGDTYVPLAGPDMITLSNGDANDPTVDYGQFFYSMDHPDPQGEIGCSAADGASVNDYSELTLTLKVPSNVNSFSFDFNYMSLEFPVFVCSNYDDTFLALLDSELFQGNISFDAENNRVSINNGFFNVCNTNGGYEEETANCQGKEELNGTGYDASSTGGGGTGWLTTTSPVRPGETITLTFIVFDEGDYKYDSQVLLDNFRWHTEQVDSPTTVD